MFFSARRQVLSQPPWITVLLQTMHDTGNSVAFCYRQFLTKSACKFARASQRDEAQHVPAFG